MRNGWKLVYKGFHPAEEKLREALCTLGNGCFATRGAAEESSADETHYPGTYIAGGYDRLTSIVAGRSVVNEDLVNFPNWLPLSFRPDGGRWFGKGEFELFDYRQELDLRGGILLRSLTVRDPEGRETRVSARRIVHMGSPHLAGIAQEILPLNWSGGLEIQSGLDGSVTNWGVARYRELRGDHIEAIDAGGTDDGLIYLYVRTKQSRLDVSLAARTDAWVRDEPLVSPGEVDQQDGAIWQTFKLDVQPGCPIRIEKVVAVCTSRGPATGDLVEDTLLAVRRAPDFEELLGTHRTAWETLWRQYDVEVDVSPECDLSPHSIQLILRLHTFHLLQTASPHSVGLDVSIPARGLHGEAYRGHIFWDEMYLFPFYLYRDPELARSLLLYRYHRLSEARANAVEGGRAGAMYPWQSGSSGREETQIIHLNPRSGAWDPDHSHLQRHVSAAIAKNVWDYVMATDDRGFLARFGAEILLEIARFWVSMASMDTEGRFEIVGVMGPDEFHETSPGASEGGLRNNAYTNVMAAWCIEKGLAALNLLDETQRTAVTGRVALSDEEPNRWREVVRGMKIPVLANGLIEQFEGYGELEELDWEAYCAKYESIGRLDRILKAEGDSPDRYKLSKQADLCMLFYVFDPEELADLLSRTGYELTEAKLHETIEYYRHRTSHGSTLSHLVFAAILDKLDPEASWEQFVEALRSDVDDIQGGTTAEGIHTAVMAGTVRHVIERFAGVRLTSEGISLKPRIPKGIDRIRLTVQRQGVLVSIDVDRQRVQFKVPDGAVSAIPARVNGVDGSVSAGEPLVVSTSSTG